MWWAEAKKTMRDTWNLSSRRRPLGEARRIPVNQLGHDMKKKLNFHKL